MSKTAIQEAIEDIKGYRTFDEVIHVSFIVALLNTYLEKERNQIVEAWCAGLENEPMSRLYAEKYFYSKYSNDK